MIRRRVTLVVLRPEQSIEYNRKLERRGGPHGVLWRPGLFNSQIVKSFGGAGFDDRLAITDSAMNHRCSVAMCPPLVYAVG